MNQEPIFSIRSEQVEAIDRQIFQNVLLTFQKQAPFTEEPDLLGIWEFLYERSVGCVDILKDWLVRAAIASLKNGEVTLSLKELERRPSRFPSAKKSSSNLEKARFASTTMRILVLISGRFWASALRRQRAPGEDLRR